MAANDQVPVGSGFHAKSTAREVVEGISLSGKHAIVTGGYSGIGLETVRALAGAGAKVTVPARRPDAAKDALTGINGVTVAAMDLADLGSVRRFAQDYSAAAPKLDLLINNAGIMACPLAHVGDGWEAQFGTNHLGHLALYQGLLPALRAANGARVVALSSTGHVRSDVIWDDPNYTSRAYDKWEAYGQSKSANALFALGVDMREKANGIRAFSVHPGGIFTNLQRHLPDEEMVALGWKSPDGTIPEMIQAMFKTPEQGASTTVWAATAPKLNGKGGVYCEDCDIARAATPDSKRWEHARAWISDDARAEKLWAMSDTFLANA
ncbi:oxidoreductase, short chain dehydrogenase/reductase family [Hyphomonas neptunium ATCC 15444]|uniref:Probable oxidoreductase n=2 Tax=Hyphomonas TaxID=85 RepID=Q0C521_HYPNA|nr:MULTISPECIES: oxidoreductase [Hyphomonas]ABI77567.1 oxidoreductase, short chain dehydrogenase/reductase family [Hyphomonas neptunium ATCC 15444]KCZ95605.1 short chain dehydrogenase/reductase family oxidoreductase [Hyphomonas hirschiana VP5]